MLRREPPRVPGTRRACPPRRADLQRHQPWPAPERDFQLGHRRTAPRTQRPVLPERAPSDVSRLDHCSPCRTPPAPTELRRHRRAFPVSSLCHFPVPRLARWRSAHPFHVKPLPTALASPAPVDHPVPLLGRPVLAHPRPYYSNPARAPPCGARTPRQLPWPRAQVARFRICGAASPARPAQVSTRPRWRRRNARAAPPAIPRRQAKPSARSSQGQSCAVLNGWCRSAVPFPALPRQVPVLSPGPLRVPHIQASSRSGRPGPATVIGAQSAGPLLQPDRPYRSRQREPPRPADPAG